MSNYSTSNPSNDNKIPHHDKDNNTLSFFRKWNKTLKDKIPLSTTDPLGDPILSQIHQMTIRILQNHNSSLPPLHTALSMPTCPRSVCHLLLRFHPDQIYIPDSEGNLPIHFLSTRCQHTHDAELYTCQECNSQLKTNYFQFKWNETIIFCHLCVSKNHRRKTKFMDLLEFVSPVEKVPTFLSDILTLYPKTASIPNARNRLPLHLALNDNNLHHLQPDVIQTLYHAAPKALITRDHTTHLYPFLTAALMRSSSKEIRLKQFQIVYDLLMEDPNLVSCSLRGKRKRCVDVEEENPNKRFKLKK